MSVHESEPEINSFLGRVSAPTAATHCWLPPPPAPATGRLQLVALLALYSRIMCAPICSVIIPTYNRRRLLAEAVGSVLNQSYFSNSASGSHSSAAGPHSSAAGPHSSAAGPHRPDIELIIVDDGSTDDTSEYLAALTRGTSGPGGSGSGGPGGTSANIAVTVLRIPHCGMPGAVRNRGVEIASGKYIAFLDSDDLWLSEKLAAQLKLHEAQPQLALSHTREHWVRGHKLVKQPPPYKFPSGASIPEGDVFAAALEKCMIGPSTAMIRRSVFGELGGFREDIQVCEDYEFWLRLTAQHEVGFLSEPQIIKRAGHSAAEGEQLSERYGRIELFRLRALAAFLTVPGLPAARLRLAQDSWRVKCLIYATGREKRGYTQEAAELRQLAERPPGVRPPAELPQAFQFFPEDIG